MKATPKASKAPDAGLLSPRAATNDLATIPPKETSGSLARLYAVGDFVQVNANYEKRNFYDIGSKEVGVRYSLGSL